MPKLKKVQISHCESPACIFVQMKNSVSDLNKLLHEMNVRYKSSLPDKRCNWSINTRCAALINGDWQRGIITEISKDGHETVVLFMDFGYTRKVQSNCLRKLHKEFLKTSGFAIRCHIHDIQPAEMIGVWPATSCNFLKDIIVENEQFFLIKMGPAENDSLPIDLQYDLLVDNGALKPSHTVRRSVKQFLLENGMAVDLSRNPLQERTKKQLNQDISKKSTNSANQHIAKSENKENVKAPSVFIPLIADKQCNIETDSENENSNANTLQHYCSPDELFAIDYEDDCLQISPDTEFQEDRHARRLTPSLVKCKKSDKAKQPILSHKHKCFRSDQNQKGAINNVKKKMNPEAVDWKPADLPKNKDFKGIVTSLDNYGFLYLHDVVTQGPTIVDVKTKLSEKYRNTKPDNYDTYWIQYQRCIVQNKEDDCWYRGQIISTEESPEFYQVKYVDYGNEARVAFHQLRKRLDFVDQPIQCYKCELDDIKVKLAPGTRWQEGNLVRIKDMLISTPVTVVIKDKPIQSAPLKVEILLPDGQNLAKWLLKLDLVEKIASSKSKSLCSDLQDASSATTEDEDFHPYKCPFETCPLPSVGTILPVTITELDDDPTKVYIQRKFFDPPSNMFEETTNTHLNKMAEMNKMMTKNFKNYKPMVSPKPGDAVCCLYDVDDCWYRGLVLGRRGSVYLTLFVDYGNKTWVEKKSLKQLPKKLRHLPMQGISCQLHQAVISNDEQQDFIATELKHILSEYKDCQAIIKELSDPVKVDLISVDQATWENQLVYQPLIDARLMKLVREKMLDEFL